MTSAPAPTDVAVTGLGLVSPAGVGVAPAWKALVAGESLLRRDPRLGDHPWALSGRVPDFDAKALLGAKHAWRLDRFVQFAIVAAREAIASAGIDIRSWDPSRVALVLGNSLGGAETFEEQVRVHADQGPEAVSGMLMPKWMPNMLAGSVAIDLGIIGESVVLAEACASGTSALGHARTLIRSGEYDIVLAGASEAAITPTVVAGLARMGALSRNPDAARASRPFDEHRDGFVIAEAAGITVLESAASLTARGATPRAWLRGYGAATDAHHITAPHPDGRGLRTAISRALADAGVTAADVGYVNAHGTSTEMNDRIERTVLESLFAPGTRVSSTKGATGHALAAAGAIEAIFTVLALEHQHAPGTVNLASPLESPLTFLTGAGHPMTATTAVSVSAGFGGHNAALVLERASR